MIPTIDFCWQIPAATSPGIRIEFEAKQAFLNSIIERANGDIEKADTYSFQFEQQCHALAELRPGDAEVTREHMIVGALDLFSGALLMAKREVRS